MALLPSWTAFQKRVDAAVDNWLAEPVELHPWSSEGYSTGGGPDPTRKVLAGPEVVGMYVTEGSRVVGESSLGMGGSDTKLLEQEVWLSIQSSIIGPVWDWRADDRVYFPARDEWFQISYVPPSATFRPNIHLMPLNDEALTATVERAMVPMARARKAR